jgi:hypothetical protein
LAGGDGKFLKNFKMARNGLSQLRRQFSKAKILPGRIAREAASGLARIEEN